MQQSSESIGAVAAASAKAQDELTNPEKSLPATSDKTIIEGTNSLAPVQTEQGSGKRDGAAQNPTWYNTNGL